MARLTKEQWAEIQAVWENDPRESFPWLVREMGLNVTVPAIRAAAAKNCWEKKVSSGKVSKKKEKKVSAEKKKGSLVQKGRKPDTTRKVADAIAEAKGLTAMQKLFVAEYLKDFNGTQAAKRAGYSSKISAEMASQNLRVPAISRAIQEAIRIRCLEVGLKPDDVVKLWIETLMLDANEFISYHRFCCPFCWGKDHQRQYTPEGLEIVRAQHDKQRLAMLRKGVDIGEFPEYTLGWWDRSKPANPDCPNCHGQGRGEVVIHDTRNLSPQARMLYGGLKLSKGAVESVLLPDKMKALENLAKALGVFTPKEEVKQEQMASMEERIRKFDEILAEARRRQREVDERRGIVIDARIVEDGNGK